MKNKIFILIFGLFFINSLVFAETVVLKSGKTLQGKIVEKTDKYIKINMEDIGIPLTYFFDDIESIDGQKVSKPAESVIMANSNDKIATENKLETNKPTPAATDSTNSGMTAETSQASHEKPVIPSVEPALKAYLMADQKKDCSGGVTLDELSIIRIGDYDRELGGWPVYANFKVTCHSGNSTYTWDGTKNSEKAMASVVRRTIFGKLECFTPKLFKEGIAQFDSLMKKELVKMQNSWEEAEKKSELLKKEARSKEEIKEGFVAQISNYADGRGTLGNLNIAGLTIWVDVQTVFEGINSLDRLKVDDCVAVAYYIFGNSKIAKRVRVLRSPKEFSEFFQKEYASLPFSLTAEKVNAAIAYFKDLGQDKQVSSLGKLDINAFDLGADIGYVKIFTPFAAIAEMAAYARNNSKELSYEDAEMIKYKPTEVCINLFLNKEDKKILDSVKCLLKIENETIDLKSSGWSFSCDKSEPNSCKGGIVFELPLDKIINLAKCNLIVKHPLRGELSVEIDLTKIK